MLEHLVLVAFLQVSGPSVPAVEGETKAPEMVCSREPVSGSRLRKQTVCKPKHGVDPTADRARDKLRDLQRSGSIFQPSPPGGQ